MRKWRKGGTQSNTCRVGGKMAMDGLIVLIWQIMTRDDGTKMLMEMAAVQKKDMVE